MMRSIAIRLSLFYLGIIMVLSIGFSAAIYSTSSKELDRRESPFKTLTLLDLPTQLDFEQEQTLEQQDARQHLQENLVLLNVVTLILGAVVSYGLARRTLQPIEDAFVAQGRFTADASHELRTPLTAMQTTIEVALRNPKLTLAQAKDLMDGTLEEVQKLSALSNSLLKLTRNPGQAIPRSPVALADTAKEAVSQLSLAAKTKDITVESQLQPMTVIGDAVSIKEVLTILLDNAIKYSPDGTTVAVAGGVHGRFAQVSVTDHGQGIKETDLAHIFDRFYRADASRSREHVEGYGLGLSIAKKIADAHGGSIEVRSKVGEGSTFTLKVPLA